VQKETKETKVVKEEEREVEAQETKVQQPLNIVKVDTAELSKREDSLERAVGSSKDISSVTEVNSTPATPSANSTQKSSKKATTIANYEKEFYSNYKSTESKKKSETK